MFDIGAPELLLVGIVALLVVGPKDLPKLLRTVGNWVGKARATARHFRTGVDAMIREAELEEMQKKWEAQNAEIMKASSLPPPASTSASSLPVSSASDAPDTPAPVPDSPAPEPPASASSASTAAQPTPRPASRSRARNQAQSSLQFPDKGGVPPAEGPAPDGAAAPDAAPPAIKP